MYVKEIKARYGSLFKTLDIDIGFAQFLRVIMAFETQNFIPDAQLAQILPNTATNESLRLFILNSREAKK